MLAERMDVRVEVEDSHVLLVFPQRMDNFAGPWQHMQVLGEILELAAGDIPNPGISTALQAAMESDQVKLNQHKECVVLLFRHADRIKFCKEAAILVARAIRKKAQDVEFLNVKKVRFVYNRQGMLKAIHNHRLDTTQIIPGR